MLEQGFASKSRKRLESTHEALAYAAKEIESQKNQNLALRTQIQTLEGESHSLKEALHDCQHRLINSETRLLEAEDEHRRAVKNCKDEHLVELAEARAEAQKKVRNTDDHAADLAARHAD
jgi:chromosome segregation ATPase